MKLLTEPEAAKILRCSTSKVKRLRKSGRLPYLAGRPLFILESDIEAYVSAERAKTFERYGGRQRAEAEALEREVAKAAQAFAGRTVRPERAIVPLPRLGQEKRSIVPLPPLGQGKRYRPSKARSATPSAKDVFVLFTFSVLVG